MHKAISTDMTVVGWTVVAVGALCLAITVLKFAPTNRAQLGAPTIGMGIALILCAIAAAGAAILAI